jgi:hypothetical protein
MGLVCAEGSPIDPYYRLRANFEQQLPNGWDVGLRQRIFYYDSVG